MYVHFPTRWEMNPCRAHSNDALIAKDFIVRNWAEQLGWDQNVFEIRVQVGMKMLLLN